MAPSSKLELCKSKNVLPTNTQNPSRKMQALLDENVCATYNAADSLVRVKLFYCKTH